MTASISNTFHNPLALVIVAWLLTIPVYVVLQIWFGYAWRGRWRIAALASLFGVAVTTGLVAVAAFTIPDGPPFGLSNVLFAAPVDGLALFAPVGLIYLSIAGVMHRTNTRSKNT